MTVTTLDPKTALLVVDLQNAVMSIATAHPNTTVVSNSAKLADAFRQRGLPVVLINAAGGAPGRNEMPPRASFGAGIEDPLGIVPELNQSPTDHLVTKRTWGAFTNTDLNDYLHENGVTQVVITGIATSAGVESTARHAHENGYNVTLATDAMTDRKAEIHDHVVANVFPRIGESGTTDEILAILDGPSRTSGTVQGLPE